MILVGKRRAQQAPSHQQMPALGCPSLLREPSVLPAGFTGLGCHAHCGRRMPDFSPKKSLRVLTNRNIRYLCLLNLTSHV